MMDAKSWFEQGLDLHAAGKIQEAILAYDEAAALAPNNAAVLHNRGLSRQSLKQHAAAAEDFRRALVLNPRLADAHFNLGNALADLNRYAEAAPAYRAAVELRPDFLQAWHNLGETLQAQGDLNAAMEAYKTAMRLEPGSFARIVNSLAAHRHGRLDLDLDALRRELTS
ncbi:MAG: tetratricopeptide repeat protein [Dongia sp.]|jgi:tetratricopeptide (TPR) repeat protein